MESNEILDAVLMLIYHRFSRYINMYIDIYVRTVEHRCCEHVPRKRDFHCNQAITHSARLSPPLHQVQ
jgi:hypothetical protein